MTLIIQLLDSSFRCVNYFVYCVLIEHYNYIDIKLSFAIKPFCKPDFLMSYKRFNTVDDFLYLNN